MSKKFGSDTVIIGEATERLYEFDGVRIKTHSSMPIDETGVIAKVLINRETQNVQIWAHMDEGYQRVFRPRHITILESKPLLLEAMASLSRGDE